jgi:hypothetical protein
LKIEIFIDIHFLGDPIEFDKADVGCSGKGFLQQRLDIRAEDRRGQMHSFHLWPHRRASK